ncbi:LysM peptidoglycan-binding domain-containing protein [Salinigranum halophilum]|jgi:nucleoid-associated protein YgaU|uniref:LysM peptidoglycan-binding domain-containing protein n=1 Tax=Salinigranum halophilum TaxID=2565931 RepID=UPI0010A777C9|nr:LysM peptidoglycan-binding domain-containing protein [Salinigranum halophilum]
MPDKPIDQKVRDLQSVLYSLYGKQRDGKPGYLLGRPRRDIKVTYYGSDEQWKHTHEQYAGTYASDSVEFLKAKRPARYRALVREHGGVDQVREHFKQEYLDDTADVPAYYDPRSNTIVTRTKAINVLAHEVVHAHAAPSSDPHSLAGVKFRDMTNRTVDESMTEYIAEEVGMEYVRKKKSLGEDIVIWRDRYSLDPAKTFISTHGKEKTLHAYFGGVFKKQWGVRYAELKTAVDGQQWVPAIPTVPPKKGWQRYVVEPGDTLWDIAEKFNIGSLWRTVYRDNPELGDDPHHIEPGQQLILPRDWPQGPSIAPPDWRTPYPKPKPQSARTTIAPKSYTVKPGDTFPTVARKFGAANQWQTLKTHNPHVGGAKHTPLPTGQKLTLPAHWQPGRARWWDGASTRRTGATSGGFAHQHDRRAGTRFDRRRDRSVGRGIGTGRGLTVEPNWMKPHQYRTVSLEPKSRPFTNRAGFDARTGGSLDGYRASDGLGPSGRLQPQKYTIKPNDTLSGIASKFGHASQWRTLYNLNRKTIGNNPHLIHPTQTLDIPAHWRYGGSY